MDNHRMIQVHILNAFVDNNRGGNPAGVVLDADGLTNEQKLLVARKVGLSETAFVSQSEVADFKLDFFTPTRQIAHCGHATIASFSYLAQLGRIQTPHSSKETIDGRRDILLDGELAFMEQAMPRYDDPKTMRVPMLEALGLAEEDLLPGAPLSIVNTGNSFAIIPVANAEILQKIVPRLEQVAQISEVLDLVGFYVFCRQASHPLRDASTRMFAPRYGINEEAGTGMAAGPLACYLYDLLNHKKEEFLVEQGWFMQAPSPSLIKVRLSLQNGSIAKLMAGGKGILVSSMAVEI
jgi:PhzF family phenazine biosynthesis protein